MAKDHLSHIKGASHLANSSTLIPIQEVFGQQQIESIANTLNLIENPKHDKLDAMKKANIGKCIAWCQKYKLPYNRTIQTTNVFLGNRVSSSY